MNAILHIKCTHKLVYERLEEFINKHRDYLIIEGEQSVDSWEEEQKNGIHTIPQKNTSYILYCSNCVPSTWVKIDSSEQPISETISLQSDEIIYKTKCPVCKNTIKNSRRIFK